MDPLFTKIEEAIRDMFDGESSGHDFHHLKRVFNLAMTLQAAEGGDRTVIGLAALSHDVHRIMQKETGRYCPPAESLETVGDILERIGVDAATKERVLHCVEYHEEYAFAGQGVTVTDIETLILQDADNLDAIGAIGVGRTFSYGGAHGLSMWEPDIPLEAGAFNEGQNDPSTLHHFYNKLFRLKDGMSTATGKRLAQERHDFMVAFAERFTAEWDGKA